MYIVDTSAFVDWWVRYYPPEILPSLKVRIEDLIAKGKFKSSISVLDELEKQDDALVKWARQLKPNIFVEDNESVQKFAIEMNDKYSFPNHKTKGISGADAFVVAQARASQMKAIVVSGEREKTAQNPKIPFVCIDNGIEHLTFTELIIKEGWKF
jgi:Domain of unknown function (DUF4411)